MKTLTLFLILVFSPCLAMAGEKVDQTLDFIEDGKIEISNINGNIEVLGWNKKQVKVVGELGDANKSFNFEREKNLILIEIRDKSHSNSGRGDQLKIYVPRKSSVNFEAPNSDFLVSGLEGNIDIEAVNGDISIEKIEGKTRAEIVNGNILCEDIKGRINLDTVNGNISANDIEGDMGKFSAVNGNITLSGTLAEIKMNTVSGDARLNVKKLENLELESVSGSANLNLELVENGRIRTSSVSGNLNLLFQKNPSAQFEITAHTGGKITNNLSKDKVIKNEYGPGKFLRFTHNGGKGSISISTLHGDIEISNK